MAASLLHNATSLTRVGAEVRVLSAGRITELGPAAAFARRVAAGEVPHVLHGERYLVIPGLINAHHHLFQSLTRCVPAAQNACLFDWLMAQYPLWRRLNSELVRAAARVSLAELLRHGCTTTSDHFYMFPPQSDVRIETVLEAAEELGIRIHACRGSMTLGRAAGGLPPDDCVERDPDVLRDCRRVLDAYHNPRPYAMRRIDLAPCSPFNVTRELLRDTAQLARERGVLLHTHLAETRDEERFCLERFGCRPVRYLADLGWLGPDVYLAHCVWLADDEIRLLGETGTGVVHCPSSNLRLASGIARIEAMRAAGVPVGLAVDGSASNDGGDLLGEARQALLLARLRSGLDSDFAARELVPAATAFELVTSGGAACLRRPELGHLNPGAAADFALFGADDLAFAGARAHDPLAALMLCHAPPAERVFVAGREVVHAGHLVGVDEARIAEDLNAAARRLA